MSDNHDYLRTGEHPSARLRGEVLMLMLKGAGYAAAACLALWFLITVIYWVGLALPEDSRFRPDPTPYSFYLTDDHIQLV